LRLNTDKKKSARVSRHCEVFGGLTSARDEQVSSRTFVDFLCLFFYEQRMAW
jgi:hypothetical protein